MVDGMVTTHGIINLADSSTECWQVVTYRSTALGDMEFFFCMVGL